MYDVPCEAISISFNFSPQFLITKKSKCNISVTFPTFTINVISSHSYNLFFDFFIKLSDYIMELFYLALSDLNLLTY